MRHLGAKTWPSSKESPRGLLLHASPELAQFRQPLLWGVPDDQARIDSTDRGADDPIRLDAGLMQRLIDAGLVRAQRAAALKNENDLSGQRLAQRSYGFGIAI